MGRGAILLFAIVLIACLALGLSPARAAELDAGPQRSDGPRVALMVTGVEATAGALLLTSGIARWASSERLFDWEAGRRILVGSFLLPLGSAGLVFSGVEFRKDLREGSYAARRRPHLERILGTAHLGLGLGVGVVFTSWAAELDAVEYGWFAASGWTVATAGAALLVSSDIVATRLGQRRWGWLCGAVPLLVVGLPTVLVPLAALPGGRGSGESPWWVSMFLPGTGMLGVGVAALVGGLEARRRAPGRHTRASAPQVTLSPWLSLSDGSSGGLLVVGNF